MARTSRKTFITNTMTSQKSIKYNVGVYIRISKEDSEQDSSIINQEKIIREYIKENPDMKIYKIYIDNGVSSFNPVRKYFEELIVDVAIGKVNCVIVKDLSRFGRDYLETGHYIETEFPSRGVRFIAILDEYDSDRHTIANDTLFVALKNLMNTQYSRDVSQKVRSVIKSKMEQGCYIPAFLPYGYRKESNEKHIEFAIDEDVSDVVKRIFGLACEGVKSFDIASALNEENTLSPGAYKYKKGIRIKTNSTKWSKYTVEGILKNRTYIGEMACKKTTNMLITRKIKRLDASEQIIIINHHEPIISLDIFNKAQGIFVKINNSIF